MPLLSRKALQDYSESIVVKFRILPSFQTINLMRAIPYTDTPLTPEMLGYKPVLFRTRTRSVSNYAEFSKIGTVQCKELTLF
jgi:hypothetical protein